MFENDDDFRSGRDARRRTAASARVEQAAKSGTLLAAAGVEDDDPVARHERARARRLKRPSMLLTGKPEGASQPPEEDHPGLHAYVRHGETPDTSMEHGAAYGFNEAAKAEGSEEQPRRSMRRTVVAATLAGTVAGAALAFAWPASYTATSEILIDPRDTAMAGNAPLTAEAAFALVDNQIRLLRSGTVLGAAAERLNLASDPEFNGTTDGPGNVFSGLANLVFGDGGRAVETDRLTAAEKLGEAVSVERVGASSVVAVSARSRDAEKAALISNTISELFAGGASTEASGERDARLEALRDNLDAAERAVEDYKARNELIDADGTLITDAEISRLGEQLSAARARTVELNARAASTQDANVDSIVTGSLPEQFASATLTELRSRYAGLKQQGDRMAAKLGPRHPERLAVEAQLEGAREEIARELRRVAGALQTELKRAVEQEQELASRLARMKVRQGDIGGELVELRELEREAQVRREAYEQALRQARSGNLAGVAAGARIISQAEPPLHASGPSVPAMSLAGALAGLLAGLGFAAWRRDGNEAEADAASAEDVEPAVVATSADVDRDAIEQQRNDATTEREEGETMYPYAPQMQPQDEQPRRHAAQQHAAPQPQHQAYGPAAPAWPPQLFAHPQGYPAQPQMHPGYAAPQPQSQAWGMTPPPAPMPAYPAWSAAQYFAPPPQAYAPPMQPQAYAPPMQPMMQQPPADPWAQHRQQPAPQPAYAAPYGMAPMPPQQPMQPAPQHASPHGEAHAAQHARDRAAADARRAAEDYDQAAFIDDRTNEAIDEIRQSLREFRAAIEDFAESRAPRRRYGT